MSIMSGRTYRSVASISRRLLSTTPGTGGETDSIRDFMKNLAEKRKSEGPAVAPSLWEKLGNTVALSSAQTARTSNSGSGGNFNNNRSFDRNGGGGRGGDGPSRGGGSFGGRSDGGFGGFGGERGGFNGGGRGGGGRGGGGRGGGRGGMVGGRGYNNRTGGGAPTGRTSSFGRSFEQDGGGRGGRGGRGNRGTAGRGAGNARRGSGGMRKFGSNDAGDDEDEERGPGGRGRRSKGGMDDLEELYEEEDDIAGDYYDEDGNYHGKNGELRDPPPEHAEGSRDGDENSEFGEDDEELFGVPDEDGIIYFAKGSLPEHQNEKLDEVDRTNMYDSEMFAEEIGGVTDIAYIDTRGFDAIDTMLAETFLEAYKSPDDTVMEAVEMPRRKRVQLPTPRSMVQLYNYTQPPVLQNSKPDDAGVELAKQAWGVIHQNFYYSDAEKYQMVESVATLYRKMLRNVELEQNKPGGVDLIFQRQFRKGARYEAEEERLKALTNIAPKEDRSYLQAETDWSVQAVLDEDQL